ncbi:MAG: hypothetical protein CL421_02675 [Acidimicrobiaceae bacterium]|nr:MAG: hypothetical protein MB53_01135 [marine actinobacterium MedAcidi-G2A]MAT01952.1 hypothetical protein [Acidimicrobiaceae bacterium]MBA4809924.1 LytR C-terminal domain-containing protein [Acidimicrobiales bacterium]|tara:strand:+ start:13278 stop:13859 length:582 start_codon:yes stop_codon:yes gene_type:complete
MNIAGKGVILILVVIAMGIFALSEGFEDNSIQEASQLSQTSQTEQQSQEENEEEVSNDSSSDEISDSEEGSEDSTVTSEESSGVTQVLHPPAEVRVLVANGTEVTGAAGATLDTLVASEGYNGVQAVNDNSEEVIAITYVYYSQGYELDALNVALIINAKSESVLPMPLELPIDDLLDANVLVHVGADLFPGE